VSLRRLMYYPRIYLEGLRENCDRPQSRPNTSLEGYHYASLLTRGMTSVRTKGFRNPFFFFLREHEQGMKEEKTWKPDPIQQNVTRKRPWITFPSLCLLFPCIPSRFRKGRWHITFNEYLSVPSNTHVSLFLFCFIYVFVFLHFSSSFVQVYWMFLN
jgi:hypothetical protein